VSGRGGENIRWTVESKRTKEDKQKIEQEKK
jgi:hypothetical protein